MERALQEMRKSRHWSALTATEPATVFALKSLLYPVIAVACLLACVLIWRQPLSGPYFLLAVLTFLAASYFLDVAKLRFGAGRNSWLQPLIQISWRWCLVVGSIALLLHLSRLDDRFDLPLLASWAIATPPMLLLGEFTSGRLITRDGERSPRRRKAVIVGLTDLGLKLERHLNSDPALRVQILGYFEDRGFERLPLGVVKRILGKPAMLPGFIEQHGIDVVYVTLPMSRHPRINGLLNTLQDSTASIYFVPDLAVFDLMQPRIDSIGGIPVVAVCETPFFGARSIAKRLSDLVVALILLLVCIPILLCIAIGVRLTSAGPIIFRQRRYGLGGEEILIYKFRSMTVTEDGADQYCQVTREDKRVTRFGALLRRFSLDELPQLLNVLEGSLSIVGPRPHAIAVNEQYRKLIPGYMRRHKIKPGITGWAQINGYRGGDDLESMRKRIEYDVEYLRNWSFALDVSIMLKTAAVVWRDPVAY